MANRVLKFLIFGLLSFAFAQAQEAKPLARHPGDVIKYGLTFDGPNADRIKAVSGGLSLKGPIQKDQSGFTNGIGSRGTLTAPKTFVLEFTVPPNIATGDYHLEGIGASADEGSADYSDPQDFKVPDIHIENPKTFTPPGITVKPLP